MASIAIDGRGGDRRWPAERIGSAAATLAVHVALGLALLWGLGAPLPQIAERALEIISVAPPPEPPIVAIPPPPPISREEAARRRRAAPDREGAAAPPNLRSEPTPVVAPEPVIPMPVPPPIISAPIAGRNNDPSAGAAPVRGPGTGAGGFGTGRGSGLGGDGGGGGGGAGRRSGRDTPPRQIGGRISEIPDWAWEQGMQGRVGVRYAVTVDGRVINCRITRSSGYRELDAHTCDLIQRRFRFRPARDENGEPFQSEIVENHDYEIRDDPDRDDG